MIGLFIKSGRGWFWEYLKRIASRMPTTDNVVPLQQVR
jgi:hypothetical protein